MLKVYWLVFEKFGALQSWIVVAKDAFDNVVRWANIPQYISVLSYRDWHDVKYGKALLLGF